MHVAIRQLAINRTPVIPSLFVNPAQSLWTTVAIVISCIAIHAGAHAEPPALSIADAARSAQTFLDRQENLQDFYVASISLT